MDVGCNCFGVATAAKVPVKRYNLLVPAIFPVTEPNPDRPLSVGVEKNLSRLSEYLGRNEHRIPKASRRLARTIHADLKRKRMGYVKVGVQAFLVLVHACDSRFARLYAQELLVRYPKRSVRFEAMHREVGWMSGILSGSAGGSQGAGANSQHETSVVGALLANRDVRAQRMGIELLMSILKIQDSAEYIASLDNFVPMLCRLAIDESEASSGVGGVSAVALQCLLEHLRLCSRISYVAKNMDVVTSAVMEIVEREGDAAIDAYEASRDARPSTASTDDANVRALSLGRMSIGSRIGASPPCEAAVLIFREIGSVSHDSVESRNVVEYWIKFMDREPARWSGGAALRVGLGILRDSCTIEHQKWVTTCALVRHLTSHSTEATLSALVRVVLSQAALLGPSDRAATLLLAIRTLGGMLGDQDVSSTPGASSEFAKTAREAVQEIAVLTGCRAQVAAVIEAALLHPSNVLGTISLCEAASAVYLDVPIQGGDSIKADAGGGNVVAASPTQSSKTVRSTTMRATTSTPHAALPAVPAISAIPTDVLNVTETMVAALQALSYEPSATSTAVGSRPQDKRFVVQSALAILRHTLEATSPGAHTSARAALALMNFMWSVVGDPDATPSMLVAVQGLFRAFTETDIAKNQGDVLAVLFLASVNRELALVSPKPSSATVDGFCDTAGVSRVQVVAVAIVARGMWECLEKSDVRGDFEAFKPVLEGVEGVEGASGAAFPLETNGIGLAVVRDGVDGGVPCHSFSTHADTTAGAFGIKVSHADPEAALHALGLSASALGPSVGRIGFLHGSENHSPRKTSMNIVAAISRVVSLDVGGGGAFATNEEGRDSLQRPPARAGGASGRGAGAGAGAGAGYESGLDALMALKVRVG